MDKTVNWPYYETYSEDLVDVVNTIGMLVDEMPTTTIDENHFILAVLLDSNNKSSYALNVLKDLLTTAALETLKSVYYQYINSKSVSAIRPNAKVKISPTLEKYIKEAERHRTEEPYFFEELDSDLKSIHILLEILADNSDSNKIKKAFNKVGVTPSIFINKTLQHYGNDSTKSTKTPNKPIVILTGNNSPSVEKDSVLSKYCTNLNELAEQGKVSKVIGRKNETEQIFRMLGRKKTNNILIVGGEGVGKTALAENLANLIVNGDVPSFLDDKVLLSFDMMAVQAGTTLRGMFEERVKKIIDEIKKKKNYILIMDNISSIFDNKKNESFDMSGLMSKALENGDIQVIGTTDFKSYRQTFEKNPTLERRFQKLIIDPPSIEDSKDILKGIKGEYEEYHNVKISDKIAEDCVNLADKYISEKNLPDSAIELMDEVGAYKGTMHEDEIANEIKNKISELEENIAKLKAEKDYKTVDKLTNDLNGLIKDLNNRKREYVKELKENPINIESNDLLYIISSKTGIPITDLTTDDKKRLLTMSDRIKAEVIGQDEHIDTVCQGIKRNRIGLHGSGCMYSAFITAKTGVGKTYFAKKLAKELFGSEDALIRFDMSEYSEKTAVNKLIGSSAGYVGYEDGGLLTEAIKKKKHCILLLDEIEKADPEVYNIFLQILDEGRLTDSSGMKVDCKNIVVLFTSNVGAKTASEFNKSIGFTEDENKSKGIMLKELKRRFPPEFLNRIDNILYFNNLNEENLKKIIEIEINGFFDKLKKLGYDFDWDKEIIDFILKIVSKEKEYGARPIKRAIQENIENPVTEAILENDDLHSKGRICVKLDNEQIIIINE